MKTGKTGTYPAVVELEVSAAMEPDHEDREDSRSRPSGCRWPGRRNGARS